MDRELDPHYGRDVITLLSPLYRAVLAQRMRASAQRIHNATDIAMFGRLASQLVTGVGVVDPELVNHHGRIAIQLVAQDGWAVILDGTSNPSAIRAMLDCLDINPSGITVRDRTSTPSLESLMADRWFSNACMTVLRTIRPHLRRLPSSLTAALIVALTRPSRLASVVTLAADAHMPRRTLERWLERVDLAGPKTWLAASRLLHGFDDLSDPGLSFARVAALHGFDRVSSLRRNVLALTGWDPTAFHAGVPADEFIWRIARALLRDRPVAYIGSPQPSDHDVRRATHDHIINI
jgi:AraC-like DNA-binding protein